MSIADRITSMSNNLSNAYDGIEYLGVDTTGVDKNLQNLSSMLNVVYEGLPKVSDEGVSPSIDGSRVGRLKSTLKASDTTQESTTGYNILPVTATTRTLNGLTFTVNADNSLTINGTATANMNFSIYNDENGINLNGDYVYYLIGKNNKINLQGTLDGSTVAFIPFANTSEYVAKTYTNSTLTRVFSYISNGATFNNETFKYMLIQGTDTTKPYEPYTGGIPSPNPDYPQDIHVVKGNNSINVQTRNLLPTNKALWESGHYNTSGVKTAFPTRMRLVDLLPVLPNTTYYVLGNNFFIREYNNNKEFINNAGTTYSTQTFTTTNQTYFLGVSVDKTYSDYVEGGGGTNNIAIFYNFEIDKNWEIGGITCYPISLGDIELCKINTYQDKFFKAISGDTIYDSLTAEQKEGLVSGGWYKYGEVGKVVFNGSEVWTSISGAPNSYYTQTRYGTYNTNTNWVLSAYFLGVARANIDNNINYVTISNDGNIRFNKIGINSSENFKIWLSSNNQAVYYILATPTITQITDTTLISQLEALYSAMSYNGQTNILQTNADNPFVIYASALKGE